MPRRLLIDNILAAKQAQLRITAIRMLFEIGITVRSLTCDGTAANVTTYKNLGCRFNLPDMITSFNHPNKITKIFLTQVTCSNYVEIYLLKKN